MVVDIKLEVSGGYVLVVLFRNKKNADHSKKKGLSNLFWTRWLVNVQINDP